MDLIAQVEPLSGGAGWVGAGMLGCVLAWLLFIHLPSLAKRDAEKDRLLITIMEAKDVSIERMMVRFEVALQLIRDHCKQEITDLTAVFERALERRIKLRDAMDKPEESP